MSDAGNLELDKDFILPLSEMHTCSIDVVLKMAPLIQNVHRKLRQSEQYKEIEKLKKPKRHGYFPGERDTGVDPGELFGSTHHRINYGALLVLYKKGVFNDPFKVAKWLATKDVCKEEYVLELQHRYGHFGPDFSIMSNDEQYQYKQGNEHEVELWCLDNEIDYDEEEFIKWFLTDFALKGTVKMAEEQQTVIAEQQTEIAKLKAELAKATEKKIDKAQMKRLNKRRRAMLKNTHKKKDKKSKGAASRQKRAMSDDQDMVMVDAVDRDI